MSDAVRQTRPKRLSAWLFKGAVSVGVLAVIFYLVPTGELWAAMLAIPLWLWGGVVAVFLCGHLAAAVKWWRLAARPAGVPLGIAVKAHFAGLVANLCLPGVAGGDVVRASLALRATSNKAFVGVGSLADRAVDCLALLMLGAGGALWSLGGSEALAGLVWQLVALAVALVVAGVAAVAVLLRVTRGGVVGKLVAALREFMRRPGELAVCLLISLAVQSVFVMLNVALARAAGLDAPVAVWFCAWPLAKLISIAPVSLAGLGVREASLAALMAPFGIGAAKVVAVGLVWQTVLLAGGAVGGLLVLLSRRGSTAQAGQPLHAGPGGRG